MGDEVMKVLVFGILFAAALLLAAAFLVPQ
jgi:hypothetical protein